jgi:UbiD family decarboxylase
VPLNHPFQDLRSALLFLEERGELLRITRNVKPEFELAAVLQNVQKTVNKAVYFEKVEGYEGGVAGNVLGSYGRVAHLLSCRLDTISSTWAERFDGFPKRQYEVQEGYPSEMKRLTIRDIPALIMHEKDGGPYITAGIVVVKDQETGLINLSYHRVQLTGTEDFGIRIAREAGHLRTNQSRCEAEGKSLECAIVISPSPFLMMTASTTMASNQSELDLASHLMGRSWRLHRCKTIDLEIPEHVELVLEGEILPNERRMEGPFGEWMGSYAAAAPQHVFRVRAVYGREKPVYYAIIPGSTEDVLLQGVPIAGSILKSIRVFVPSVVDVACWPNQRYCIIQMKKRSAGEERKALLAALGAELNRILYAIVVDEDVDIHDPQELLWAISTRCRPDKDVIIIPEVPSSSRDPFQRHWGRLAIDATAPLDLAAEFERKRIPGADRVKWEDYL